MKTILSSETMNIPDGVSIKVHAKVIEVEGPRGKLVRDFKHLNLDFELITDDNGQKKLKIEAWFGSRKTSASIRTALSHVGNLITGVTKGYRYKMRFVYAHFPINASITNSNSSIEIRNFLGEKKVRKVDMLAGVSVVRSEKVKDELVLDGNDIELVSRSCALINQVYAIEGSFQILWLFVYWIGRFMFVFWVCCWISFKLRCLYVSVLATL
ncbi:large ribosomal subunit protein uL6 isoform X1 [Gastrolobium bilobum]|uniref:large ribosomal subunit protein uL6 isoform X1 n=1 Tax=Gastrolobium bilobum TaxID=150636 RepID=UPI002AAF6610|nr:large ribosomal subunit protein uL6 isoform X1 [Gastrolobium bilobum]